MRRVVEVLLLVVAAVIAVFWTVWFLDRDLIAANASRAYVEHENSFPLADAWLALACVLAFVAMRRGVPSALFWLIAAGASAVFLCLMDLLYAVQQGSVTEGAGTPLPLLIVVGLAAFSVIVLRWSWSHRGELLST